MPKPYRRLLFFCFLGCFLLFAPLLILYASGYRYNWNRGRIQETGVLRMVYAPAHARITLNDEQQRTQTPATIGGLLPGRYAIEVSADEYRSWKKKLWVEPSRTTFAQHMILWRDEPKQRTLTEKPPVSISTNVRGVISFALRDGQRDRLFVVDPERDTTEEIQWGTTPGTNRVKTMVWSPKGRRLFFETEMSGTKKIQQWVWTAADAATANIAQMTNSVLLSHIQWGATDDDLLYGVQRQPTPHGGPRLMEIDLFRGRIRALSYSVTTPTTPPLFIEDDLLYRIESIVTQGEQRSTLIIAPLSETTRALERRISLPRQSEHISFLPSPDQFITLLDKAHKTLFIIDKETRALYPVQETIEGVTDAVWSPKGNRLLWNTGKELWLLDLELSRREQLRVEQQKIQNILWHPGNEYIFYDVGDDVRVLEIDGRDERNIETIATIPNHSGLSISQSGEFFSTIGPDGLLSYRVTE